MSYDLMVFAPSAAPDNHKAFMSWYEERTQWEGDYDYDDTTHTHEVLRNWFKDMIVQFPAMNGPFAKDEEEDNPKLADYSIDEGLIYVAFGYPVAEEAYTTVKQLAAKHEAGFYDVSGEGKVFLPDGPGKLKPAFAKRGWQFWK